MLPFLHLLPPHPDLCSPESPGFVLHVRKTYHHQSAPGTLFSLGEDIGSDLGTPTHFEAGLVIGCLLNFFSLTPSLLDWTFQEGLCLEVWAFLVHPVLEICHFMTTTFFLKGSILFLFRCLSFKDVLPPPLFEKKLLLPFVSFYVLRAISVIYSPHTCTGHKPLAWPSFSGSSELSCQ
jgi:hypothetical protein